MKEHIRIVKLEYVEYGYDFEEVISDFTRNGLYEDITTIELKENNYYD